MIEAPAQVAVGNDDALTLGALGILAYIASMMTHGGGARAYAHHRQQ
jgi:hypothetical protein